MTDKQRSMGFIEDAVAADKLQRMERINHNANVGRTWCDPSKHTQVIGVDFGKGAMCFSSLPSGREEQNVRLGSVPSVFSTFDRGALVIAEAAHLAVPQTEQSLAQPFTASDLASLFSLCEERGLTLRLFPQGHTRKAREWSAVNGPHGFVDEDKTTDINDARALAWYVLNNNGTGLSKPPASFDRHPARDYGAAVVRCSNIVLNAERVTEYDGSKFPAVAQLAGHIVAEAGGLNSFINHMAAFSIASLVMTELYGVPVRYVMRGNVLGFNNWIKNVARFSSRHWRGGIARSNLCHHRFRPFFSQYASSRGVCVKEGPHKYVAHGKFTPEQDQMRRDSWNAARRGVKNAYEVAVEMSRNFEPYEVLRGVEATHAS